MTEKYIYTFSKAERFASKLRNREVCIKNEGEGEQRPYRTCTDQYNS